MAAASLSRSPLAKPCIHLPEPQQGHASLAHMAARDCQTHSLQASYMVMKSLQWQQHINCCRDMLWLAQLRKRMAESRFACEARRFQPPRTWYAESKKGSSRFCCTTFRMPRHCSGVGSTPVGLCAQACSTTMAPSGALCRSWSIPCSAKRRTQDAGTPMQHRSGALWGALQILDHSLQCQRDISASRGISASKSPLQRPLK